MGDAERTVLLCGGGTAVDLAIARELSRPALRLLVHAGSGSVEGREELFLRSLPRSRIPSFLPYDVSSVAGCEELIRTAWEMGGGLDAVVLHPVVSRPGSGSGLDDPWPAALSAGLKWPFFLARAAGLRMRDRGGRIVVVAADDADGAAAAVVRRALVTMTRGLARALPEAVSVSAVVADDHEEEKAGEGGGTGGAWADQVARTVCFLVAGEELPTETVIGVGGASSFPFP